MPEFEARVTLPHSAAEVFDFLIRPAHLLQLIPPDAGMEVLSVPEVLVLGSRLEFKITGFGQTLKLRHEVTELVSPTKMTERQLFGLFKTWTHEHVIEPDSDGQVTLIDRIEFQPPGGLLGFVITKGKVLEQLDWVFDQRNQQIRKMLGDPK